MKKPNILAVGEKTLNQKIILGRDVAFHNSIADFVFAFEIWSAFTSEYNPSVLGASWGFS